MYKRMIKPVQHGSLKKRVTSHLFDAIVTGELAPGERILEGKVAKQLHVSHGTLREALQELEHQGLVTKYEKRGTFVTNLTFQDLEDIHVVRLQLEPLAGMLAYQRMKPDDFSQLEKLVETMRVTGERGEFVELCKADLSFHRLIWNRSGNRSLDKALNLVCIQTFAFDLIRLYSAETYDFAKAYEEHCELLDVLKKGGPEEVKKTFQEMLKVFRAQDIRNIRALEAERKTLQEKPTIDVPTSRV